MMLRQDRIDFLTKQAAARDKNPSAYDISQADINIQLLIAELKKDPSLVKVWDEDKLFYLLAKQYYI